MSRRITKIILHHSDSDIKSHDDISVIDGWHKERGFRCTLPDGSEVHVGYHYFITTKGVVQEGRPEHRVGAHCYGENTSSIGICLHGKDEFSSTQFKALTWLVRSLLTKYPEATIHGHNEFASKDCPVFSVDDFMEDYMSNMDEINVNG